MPLSKQRNRERMRKIRLHKRLSPLVESKPVQPKPVIEKDYKPEVDADGNLLYEEL